MASSLFGAWRPFTPYYATPAVAPAGVAPSPAPGPAPVAPSGGGWYSPSAPSAPSVGTAPVPLVVVPPPGAAAVPAGTSGSVGGAELPLGELVAASDLGLPMRAVELGTGDYRWPDATGGAWRWESLTEWWRRVRQKG